MSQFFFVKIQAVASVLRNDPGQVRAQPVKYGHKVIDDHLNAVFGQIADGNAVILDIPIPGRQTHFDVLVDVDAFNDLALQARLVNMIDIGLNLLLCPDFTCRLIVQQSHKAGAAGDLANIL